MYFNSWLEDYKRPFGAIQQEETCQFRILAGTDQIHHLHLIICKEHSAKGEESYPMVKEGQYYTCDYTLDQGKGLYFYHFSFQEKQSNGDSVTKYYAPKGQGGEGQIYDSLEGMPAYQLTCFEQAEQAPDWYRESVFYQIFPDRFYNGNEHKEITSPKPNTFIYGTTADDPMYIKNEKGEIIRWDFYGGNLLGIKKKIPYLKELGINAIYLNPIFKAASNHRYDTGDYMMVDPMLGDETILTELIEELHQEGIRLILDGVFSHVGRNSLYFNYDGSYGEGQGAYQNHESPYHPWFTFTDYPHEYRSWWGIDDLPEIDKSNQDFQAFIYGDNGVLTKWNQLDIDGWRIDVADELPDFFLKGLRANLNQFEDKVLIGEVWEDASNKIAYDQRRHYILGHHLHGVMNYPLRDLILQLLNGETTPKQVCEVLTQLQENYPRDVFYNNFNNIGTHDTERIYTMLGESLAKTKLAFGLMFMSPGIPCVYYGDEAGVAGGKDPENRKFFPWDNMDQELFESCKSWIDQRKQHDCLKFGEFIPFYTEDLFGIIRYQENNYIIYIVNPHEQEVTFDVDQVTTLRPFPFSKEEFPTVSLAGQADYILTSK